MGKVFLSHSSYDKDFVGRIAELFGKDRCVFDELTFELGIKNIDEIFKNLDNTDIFVYFISDRSLNSNWVNIELNKAQEKLQSSSNKVKQIFPIIIDPKIKYSDSRIADFLKKDFDSYNLRHIKNYKLAYKKIISQQINLQMTKDTTFEEKKNLFYGRDLEIKSFKDRYDDSTRQPIKCMVVSGIEGIGRQSFVREALKSAKLIKPYYFPSTISLNRNETIDDLIIKISDLGFGDYSLEDITAINEIDSKIEVLAELLLEAQSYNEHILIYDDMCLIGLDQTIKYWFEIVLEKIKKEIVISIATNVKLDYIKYRGKDDIFFIELIELQPTERAGLLRAHSELEDILFDREDIGFLQGSLTGYPPQIIHCVDLAKANSVEYVKSNSYKVVEYSSNKASKILNTVIEKNKKISYGLLSFLSEYDTVPVKIIYDIFSINHLYQDIMDKFVKLTICRHMGASNEYIKVNSVIQDYIQRNKFELPKDIADYLKESVKEFNKNIDDPKYTDFIDFSELSYYIKENLKNEEYVPKKFLYSTIFIRSIVDLYNNKKIDKVISIIKGLKENGAFDMYDVVAQKQIQYYYCQSLAHKRSGEFFTEIEFFGGKENYINYNFLKGFNFRILGKLENAEIYFKNVLSKSRNHYKTKRELVTVYRLLDDYDNAYDLAEDNYRNDPENIYQIQAYFDCLIRSSCLSSQQLEDLHNILATIEKVHSEKANVIYYQMNALYQAYVCKNKTESVKILKHRLKDFDASIYLAKDLFDIYEKFEDIGGMKEALEILSLTIKDGGAGFENIFICRQAIYDAYIGKSRIAIEISLSKENVVSKRMKEYTIKKVEDIIKRRKTIVI